MVRPNVGNDKGGFKVKCPCMRRHFPHTGPVTDKDFESLLTHLQHTSRVVDVDRFRRLPGATDDQVQRLGFPTAPTVPPAPTAPPPPPNQAPQRSVSFVTPPAAPATPSTAMLPGHLYAKVLARRSSANSDDWNEYYQLFFAMDSTWKDAVDCHHYFRTL